MATSKRLVLFALTGLGNPVLERLVQCGFKPDLVVTRAEPSAYPYDTVPFIGDVARRLGIPCDIDLQGEHNVATHGADILLVATYHRLIKRDLRRVCGLAINLHPSLLPRNRGANPIFWSIYNGDIETGVSAHALTDQADAGPICAQASLAIEANETQTSLRRRLGLLSATVAEVVVKSYHAGSLSFSEQNHDEATTHPRLTDEMMQIDLRRTSEQVRHHVNALRDWPLARLGDRRIRRVAPDTRGYVAVSSEIKRERTADSDIFIELDPSA